MVVTHHLGKRQHKRIGKTRADKRQAEEIANAHFGGSPANLQVRKGTVRAVRDEAAYHNSHPNCD